MGTFLKWWKRISTRSRNLAIIFLYKANLWKYNFQKTLDTMLHGRPHQTKHIPFMITRKMKNSLYSLGYLERDINKMTPLEATNAINLCIRKTTKALPRTEIGKDNSTGPT